MFVCILTVMSSDKKMLDPLLQLQVVVSHPLSAQEALPATEWSLHPRMPTFHCWHKSRLALKPRVLVVLRRALSATMQLAWHCQGIYFFSKPTKNQIVFYK